MRNSAILLVQRPDRKGLDTTIAEFIYRHDGTILRFEQHQAGDEHYYLARCAGILKIAFYSMGIRPSSLRSVSKCLPNAQTAAKAYKIVNDIIPG